MSILTFDIEPHEYRLDGKVIPSVTQILMHWSSMRFLPPAILIPAGERGTAVHLACQYDDEGDLDEQSIEEARLMGYVEAWRRFRREHDFTATAIEERVFSVQHNFAGTLDRRGHLLWPTGRGRSRVPVLLDIKSGVADPVHKMQTAAYAHAAAPGKWTLRMSIYLKDDGRYQLQEYTEFANDWADFLACRRSFEWRKRNNVET